MTVFQALRDGIRRVNSAPALLLGVWMMTLLVSVPLTLAMRGQLAAHLDASLAADAAASGVNYDWMQEFSGQASGVGDHVLARRHRVRRAPRQPERVRRPAAAAAAHRVLPRSCTWRLWILRGRRHHRSIRAGPGHPHGRVLLGVGGVSSSGFCGSASWRRSPTGCCSVSSIPGCSARSSAISRAI